MTPRQAASLDAAQRAGYKDYAQDQRVNHERSRRDDQVAHLRSVAYSLRARASDLAGQAIEAQRAGYTARADYLMSQSNGDMRDAYQLEDQAQAVLDGSLIPPRVDVEDNRDWTRINDDVGNLATGGVYSGNESALTGTDHPPSVDSTRPYGQRGGLRPPLAAHQIDLEAAMPRDANGEVVRTADPRVGDYFGLLNDGGPTMDTTRSINCQDCVLSFFDTWVHGRPRVSAPRTFDAYANGNPERPLDGEADGPGRAEDLTGGRYQGLCPDVSHLAPADAQQAMNHATSNLHYQLLSGGHGSFAFIITQWEGKDGEPAGAHAWAAVNQNGTILYVDPQSGRYDENAPLYWHHGSPYQGNPVRMDALVTGPNGDPMPLPNHPPGFWSSRPPLPAGADGMLPSAPYPSSSPAPAPASAPPPPSDPAPTPQPDLVANPAADPEPDPLPDLVSDSAEDPEAAPQPDLASGATPDLAVGPQPDVATIPQPDTSTGRSGPQAQSPEAIGLLTETPAAEPATDTQLPETQAQEPQITALSPEEVEVQDAAVQEQASETSEYPGLATPAPELPTDPSDPTAQPTGPSVEPATDPASPLGGTTSEALANAQDVESALDAGLTPVELAAALDPTTLRRMNPTLSDVDADGIATMLGDPRVQDMFARLEADPPPNQETLGRELVVQISAQPDLARIFLRSPELATALAARPLTMHHVASYPEAIAALDEVLDDIDAGGPAPGSVDLTPGVQPTPLTDAQRAISQRVAERARGRADQPGFDYSRQSDEQYREAYLDFLYKGSVAAQAEVTALAQRIAREGEPGGGRPGWRTDPKERERARQKIAGWRGNVAKLRDLAGAKVEFDSLGDLYAALDLMRSDPAMSIVQFDDRFISPEKSGYRDVQMFVRASNGHVAEFRLHLKSMDIVAKWEHALYEVRRDLKALATAQDRELVPLENAMVTGILGLERRVFWEALQEALPGGSNDFA